MKGSGYALACRPDNKYETKLSADRLKGTAARPGGPLTSKPTWSSASGYSATSAFFMDRQAYLREDLTDEHASAKSEKSERAQASV